MRWRIKFGTKVTIEFHQQNGAQLYQCTELDVLVFHLLYSASHFITIIQDQLKSTNIVIQVTLAIRGGYAPKKSSISNTKSLF